MFEGAPKEESSSQCSFSSMCTYSLRSALGTFAEPDSLVNAEKIN